MFALISLTGNNLYQIPWIRQALYQITNGITGNAILPCNYNYSIFSHNLNWMRVPSPMSAD